jgi:hypothetical protein
MPRTTIWLKRTKREEPYREGMLIRGLIEREGSADRFTLTDQGRAVLEVLMMKAAARGQ